MTLSTLAWRALRRLSFVGSRGSSMSRLALRVPRLRVGRPAFGETVFVGGWGTGVVRRLEDRTPFRSAMFAIPGWKDRRASEAGTCE